jgi:hypothetical protein
MEVQGKEGMQQGQKKYSKDDRMILSCMKKYPRAGAEFCYFINNRDDSRDGLGF